MDSSKDEKIRKRLIDFFEDWHENRSHCWGIAVTDILAWLEKQQTMNSEEMLDLLRMEYSKGRYDAITKATEWLDEHLLEYWGQQNSDPSEFLVKFKKAMEQ